ncbi:hypothetical protein EYZ11_012572 [Aspergillus tanneri]|uniref:Uncharacterized protein n=1 Tax=Aspergillus tanneri TaxID=1220188 RepID=A0A4S3IZX9_9EURO|nr:hypothetical protein EYZ11_012572 [Aspergillus tanneri]
MAAGNAFTTYGTVPLPGAHDSKAEPLRRHQEEICDQSRVRHWLEADTSHVKDLGDMPIRNMPTQGNVMGESIQYWPQEFSSLNSQENISLQPSPHETQRSPALGTRDPSMQDESEAFISDYRHDQTTTATLESDRMTKGETPDSSGATLGLIHPVDQPSSLYIANRNMTSFTMSKMESETTPICFPPRISHHDCMPETMSEAVVVQKPGWTTDSSGTVPPFHRSPEGGSVDTTDNSFTPIDTVCSPTSPLPWSTFGIQPSLDMQRQSICTAGAEIPNVNEQNGRTDGSFDQTAAADDSLYGLTLLVPNREPLGMNREQQPFTLATDAFAYHEYLYRLNQLTHPKFTMDGGHLCQQLLGNRSFSCHSEKRNAFLIECKRRGLSYKDIKRLGGFKEAESTLRGRFRTLTKSKEQRVRKPQWQEKDVSNS